MGREPRGRQVNTSRSYDEIAAEKERWVEDQEWPYRQWVSRAFKERRDATPKAKKEAVAGEQRILGKLAITRDTIIYELLQNADDYPKIDEQGGKLLNSVYINYDGEHLCFAHDGAEFSEGNFEAITSLGVSDDVKQSDAETIGYKGIGFKALFTYSNDVIVRSGRHLRFGFRNDEELEGMPWGVMPRFVPEFKWKQIVKTFHPVVQHGYGVCVVAKIDQDEAKEQLGEVLTRLIKAPETLAFLRRIRKVVVEFGGEKYKIEILKEEGSTQLSVNGVVELFDMRLWKSIAIPEDVKEKLQNTFLTPNLPEKLRFIKEINLSLAIGSGAGDTRSFNLAAYLPFIESKHNLPFIVNADFVPNEQRSNPEEGSALNDFILEQTGKMAAEVVTEIASSGNFRRSASLIRQTLSAKRFSKSFEHEFEQGIKQSLYADKGEAIRPAEELVYDPSNYIQMLTGINSYAAPGIERRYVLHEEYDDIARSLTSQDGIKTLGIEDFAVMLSNHSPRFFNPSAPHNWRELVLRVGSAIKSLLSSDSEKLKVVAKKHLRGGSSTGQNLEFDQITLGVPIKHQFLYSQVFEKRPAIDPVLQRLVDASELLEKVLVELGATKYSLKGFITKCGAELGRLQKAKETGSPLFKAIYALITECADNRDSNGSFWIAANFSSLVVPVKGAPARLATTCILQDVSMASGACADLLAAFPDVSTQAVVDIQALAGQGAAEQASWQRLLRRIGVPEGKSVLDLYRQHFASIIAKPAAVWTTVNLELLAKSVIAFFEQTTSAQLVDLNIEDFKVKNHRSQIIALKQILVLVEPDGTAVRESKAFPVLAAPSNIESLLHPDAFGTYTDQFVAKVGPLLMCKEQSAERAKNTIVSYCRFGKAIDTESSELGDIAIALEAFDLWRSGTAGGLTRFPGPTMQFMCSNGEMNQGYLILPTDPRPVPAGQIGRTSIGVTNRVSKKYISHIVPAHRAKFTEFCTACGVRDLVTWYNLASLAREVSRGSYSSHHKFYMTSVKEDEFTTVTSAVPLDGIFCPDLYCFQGQPQAITALWKLLDSQANNMPAPASRVSEAQLLNILATCPLVPIDADYVIISEAYSPRKTLESKLAQSQKAQISLKTERSFESSLKWRDQLTPAHIVAEWRARMGLESGQRSYSIRDLILSDMPKAIPDFDESDLGMIQIPALTGDLYSPKHLYMLDENDYSDALFALLRNHEAANQIADVWFVAEDVRSVYRKVAEAFGVRPISADDWVPTIATHRSEQQQKCIDAVLAKLPSYLDVHNKKHMIFQAELQQLDLRHTHAIDLSCPTVAVDLSVSAVTHWDESDEFLLYFTGWRPALREILRKGEIDQRIIDSIVDSLELFIVEEFNLIESSASATLASPSSPGPLVPPQQTQSAFRDGSPPGFDTTISTISTQTVGDSETSLGSLTSPLGNTSNNLTTDILETAQDDLPKEARELAHKFAQDACQYYFQSERPEAVVRIVDDHKLEVQRR